jgi:hypothetical protein
MPKDLMPISDILSRSLPPRKRKRAKKTAATAPGNPANDNRIGVDACAEMPWPSPDSIAPLSWWRRVPQHMITIDQHDALAAILAEAVPIRQPVYPKGSSEHAVAVVTEAFNGIKISARSGRWPDPAMSALLLLACDGHEPAMVVLGSILRSSISSDELMRQLGRTWLKRFIDLNVLEQLIPPDQKVTP